MREIAGMDGLPLAERVRGAQFGEYVGEERRAVGGEASGEKGGAEHADAECGRERARLVADRLALLLFACTGGRDSRLCGGTRR